MNRFFYRMHGLDLMPGNKSAGFVLSVDTAALHELTHIDVSLDDQDRLVDRARERAARAQLGSKALRESMGLWFLGDTPVPRVFSTHPSFGGSLGADPETFSRLKGAGSVEFIGPEVDYTPHNVDRPVDAMLLMMLAQTWGEWATDLLGWHTTHGRRTPSDIS